MQPRGADGAILSTCMRELVDLTQNVRQNIVVFMGLAYDPMHSTVRRKNSLPSTVPEG